MANWYLEHVPLGSVVNVEHIFITNFQNRDFYKSIIKPIFDSNLNDIFKGKQVLNNTELSNLDLKNPKIMDVFSCMWDIKCIYNT